VAEASRHHAESNTLMGLLGASPGGEQSTERPLPQICIHNDKKALQDEKPGIYPLDTYRVPSASLHRVIRVERR
jgi:hypothetical protein